MSFNYNLTSPFKIYRHFCTLKKKGKENCYAHELLESGALPTIKIVCFLCFTKRHFVRQMISPCVGVCIGEIGGEIRRGNKSVIN